MHAIPGSSRRAFLAAATGAVPIALPWAARGLQDPVLDDAADLMAFGRLADLRFTADEARQAKRLLQGQRRDYQTLRALPTPFELAPCTHFDPCVGGAPAQGPGAAWTPPAVAKLPDRDVDLAFASVDQLSSLLRQQLVTSRRLTELALGRLERFDKDLFCAVTLLQESALAAADRADREIADGKWRSPLHGIPYGAKDLFAWPGAPTTFGAAPYKDVVWPLTATVLQKLEDAGAVLCAKLSLGALAMGDLWFGGRTRTPYNPAMGSSGSSAGSASSVAAGLLPFSLGTETLGSIVSPCRMCGVGGLRPTFGAVSRHGAMPLSWTMDKVGVIARSAVDQALVFDAIRGADGVDPSARHAAFPWRRGAPLQGLRFGRLAGERSFRRDDERAFVAWLGQQGGELREVTLPDAPYGALLVMLHAEGAAAFDQLLRSGGLPQLPGQGDGDWPNLFRAARAIPAVEYLQASRRRRQLCADMHKVMADVDVLVAPTHGGPTLTCTNLTGHPTLVLPVGRGDDGKPTVIGLTGKLFGEAALFAVAEAWQQHTDFHLSRPRLSS